MVLFDLGAVFDDDCEGEAEAESQKDQSSHENNIFIWQ
jgi:hypothetical protein